MSNEMIILMKDLLFDERNLPPTEIKNRKLSSCFIVQNSVDDYKYKPRSASTFKGRDFIGNNNNNNNNLTNKNSNQRKFSDDLFLCKENNISYTNLNLTEHASIPKQINLNRDLYSNGIYSNQNSTLNANTIIKGRKFSDHQDEKSIKLL
jgi:hypothetical protein